MEITCKEAYISNLSVTNLLSSSGTGLCRSSSFKGLSLPSCNRGEIQLKVGQNSFKKKKCVAKIQRFSITLEIFWKKNLPLTMDLERLFYASRPFLILKKKKENELFLKDFLIYSQFGIIKCIFFLIAYF